MSNYHNGIPQKVLKFVSKSAHEVTITLDRSASLEDWKGITAK